MSRAILTTGAKPLFILIQAIAFWPSLAAHGAAGATRFDTPAFRDVAGSNTTPCAMAETPVDVVSAVVKLDNGRDWAPVFAEKPTPLMLRYFTSAFNAAWANAMKHNRQEPVLDGDPITGGQGVTSLALRSVKSGPVEGTGTTVLATLSVRSEGVAKPVLQTVTFTMKRDGASWKIDDISGPVDGTLRTYFRKTYGQ